jgi:predicted transcriptional regulator
MNEMNERNEMNQKILLELQKHFSFNFHSTADRIPLTASKRRWKMSALHQSLIHETVGKKRELMKEWFLI